MDAVYECQATRYSKTCTEKALADAGIDSSKLKGCLSNTGPMLAKEHDLMLEMGVVYNPAVVVNRHVYRVSHQLLPSHRAL